MPADETAHLKIINNAISVPPKFCEYSTGPCDQNFSQMLESDALFLFPSDPPAVASTFDEAVAKLRTVASARRWITWRHLEVAGQIIFCEICKAMRFTKLVVADVTTLNFNLMFEIGYALGLGLPIVPMRDTTYQEDKREFDELGLLETFGYVDFQNSNDIRDHFIGTKEFKALCLKRPVLNDESPLYIVKSPVENDGMIKLMSVVKKSRLRFRTLDTKEVGRISLHETYKNTLSSRAVILHLLDPRVYGARVHNGRCALIAGLAMSAGKRTVLLQQIHARQPIDYRDVILTYNHPKRIQDLLVPVLGEVIEEIQTIRFVPTSLPVTPLEKIDLGDLAAENEIKALDSYYIPTAQYHKAKQGHARLVVGRKGAGKSALFFSLRSTFRSGRSHLVLDLRPEGHQFTKLRELVLAGLSTGVKQHLLAAFWNYLLLVELGWQITRSEESAQYRDPRLKEAYAKVAEFFPDEDSQQADFSERLLKLVDEISVRRDDGVAPSSNSDITNLIHTKHIRSLSDAIADYLNISHRDIWILFDNLDKAWPVQSVKPEDILLLRSLLESTRKLQRQFESRHVELYAIVFIRSDIYQHLVLEPAERGKETTAVLDWNDPEALKEVLARRLASGLQEAASFDVLWARFFPAHVHGEDSFAYVLSRTQMRPRELLRFVRECIDTAINRRHHKVSEEDVLKAEETYSSDQIVDVSMEMKDVEERYHNAPYSFIGCSAAISKQEVDERLKQAGIPAGDIPRVLELLLWFGVLGIMTTDEEERYAYQYDYDPYRMLSGVSSYAYCIHPAFRSALGTE